ncbi:hypothetical protein KEM54_006427 [Ascosphaera aggregata]|nr:hypothetical protein KEM54_006427 [Ascosphaera aggregata]
MSKEEIEEYVSQAIQEIRKDGKKPLVGTVFKLLFGAEGGLRDKPVRKQDVKDVFDRLVKRLMHLSRDIVDMESSQLYIRSDVPPDNGTTSPLKQLEQSQRPVELTQPIEKRSA